MKGVVYMKYGSPDVLEVRELPVPVPKDAEVLVRMRASSVNPIDWHFMRGTPLLIRAATGLQAPRRKAFGRDVSGVVEAVGPKVTRFKPGDAVFGVGAGAFAEYVSVSE